MKSSKILHVVAFDVPFPADYGGVIDVFYKLKALHNAGVKIILHCFEYGRSAKEELEKITDKVYYYPRKNSRSLLFNTLPYIVLTRDSEALKQQLLQDDFPILMEGLHSTLLLNDDAFSKRNIIVRTHNIEHEYYNALAVVEKNIFKRYYFYNEAGKLLKYEKILKSAANVAAISPKDAEYFQKINTNTKYIPAFHPFDSIDISLIDKGFFLYHGNLSVGENNEAAIYLVEKIFDDLPYKLIIAGNKPSVDLQKAVGRTDNVELKQHCSPEEIYQLISSAHCNILPTFQSTGIKLKLLAALFSGKFCIVNQPMVQDTGLEHLCIIANDIAGMKQKVEAVANEKEFSKVEIEKRKEYLELHFSNTESARQLIELVFEK